jgi:hypothetical protein
MPWIGFEVSGRSLRLGCGYSLAGAVIVAAVGIAAGWGLAAVVGGTMLGTLLAVVQVVRAGER